MKKVLLMLTIISSILLGTSNVEAKAFTFDTYNSLGIKSSFVVGEYIFDLDSGYSPTLEDIMTASRSIAAGKPTTLYSYQIYPLFGTFRQTEIYSNEQTKNKSEFKVFQANYIYRSNIKDADESDYDVLS